MRTHQPIDQESHLLRDQISREIEGRRKVETTFSETRLLLPFKSSGAIHGSVPRTPPDIRVWHFTLDSPRSPTWNSKEWCSWKEWNNYRRASTLHGKKSIHWPCKWVDGDLGDSPADYHFSDQNARYFFHASIPYQRPHPLQSKVASSCQDSWFEKERHLSILTSSSIYCYMLQRMKEPKLTIGFIRKEI